MRTRKNVTTMHFGVEEVVEKVKEDTWVLAIILGCFCLLSLMAGGMRAACQTRKNSKKEDFVRNIYGTEI